MKTKKSWLFKDAKNILFVCGGAFFICASFTIIMNKLGIAHFWMYEREVSKNLFYPCVFAPITEEIIFRWLPITFILAAMANKDNFKKFRWYFAGLISLVFAVAHYGYFSIFIQGVFGLGLCYLYYKNRYGYLSAVIAHSLWNFSLSYILPTVGYNPVTNPFGW